MKTVRLLRHAKSSWEDASLRDQDRPLAPRGLRDAATMAEHLRATGARTDVVLCSPSARTVQTLERIAVALPGEVDVRLEEALYHASARGLLQRLRQLPDRAASVLMIGHNPGIHDLALALSVRGRGHPGLARKFPTGALATLSAPIERWEDLAEGQADLIGFAAPSELNRPGEGPCPA